MWTEKQQEFVDIFGCLAYLVDLLVLPFWAIAFLHTGYPTMAAAIFAIFGVCVACLLLKENKNTKNKKRS